MAAYSIGLGRNSVLLSMSSVASIAGACIIVLTSLLDGRISPWMSARVVRYALLRFFRDIIFDIKLTPYEPLLNLWRIILISSSS